MVVDPPDGRVPALTPAARDADAARAEVQRRQPEGPEDFALQIRCIVWQTSGTPMVPGPYNNNYQIVQTRDSVAIDVEMIHDARIIPLDGRPDLASAIRQWKGDSVGHWEGDTLVVDTIGFNDTGWLDIRGYFHSENMHVVERLRREGSTLTWSATVEDPDVLLKPWTMNSRVMKLDPDPKATLAESLPCVEHDLSHLVTREHH
jgi:hypothetical protein